MSRYHPFRCVSEQLSLWWPNTKKPFDLVGCIKTVSQTILATVMLVSGSQRNQLMQSNCWQIHFATCDRKLEAGGLVNFRILHQLVLDNSPGAFPACQSGLEYFLCKWRPMRLLFLSEASRFLFKFPMRSKAHGIWEPTRLFSLSGWQPFLHPWVSTPFPKLSPSFQKSLVTSEHSAVPK